MISFYRVMAIGVFAKDYNTHPTGIAVNTNVLAGEYDPVMQ